MKNGKEKREIGLEKRGDYEIEEEERERERGKDGGEAHIVNDRRKKKIASAIRAGCHNDLCPHIKQEVGIHCVSKRIQSNKE